MSDLKCGVAGESGSAPLSLTVGQVFIVRCQGHWPGFPESRSLDLKNWHLAHDVARPAGSEAPEMDPYAIHLLSARQVEAVDEGKIYDLEFVSYRLGEHPIKALQLLSEESSVVLGDFELSVKTVQSQDKPIEEPFPIFGPLGYPFPMATAVLALVLVVTSIALVARPIIKRNRRRRWMKEVPSIRQQQPEQALYKALRHDRTIAELNLSLRYFLARRSAVPFHRLETGKALREANKHPLLRATEVNQSIHEVLREFDQSLKANLSSPDDLEALRNQIRKMLDVIGRFDQNSFKNRGMGL